MENILRKGFLIFDLWNRIFLKQLKIILQKSYLTCYLIMQILIVKIIKNMNNKITKLFLLLLPSLKAIYEDRI